MKMIGFMRKTRLDFLLMDVVMICEFIIREVFFGLFAFALFVSFIVVFLVDRKRFRLL